MSTAVDKCWRPIGSFSFLSTKLRAFSLNEGQCYRYVAVYGVNGFNAFAAATMLLVSKRVSGHRCDGGIR
ncbi:hypothetical protein K239x_03540 [Planctomycetes bacterium K23_9]|uniref:Uncharacterized protein n=1 Tax=Stieleria marina TaxID=1930275 RepID=A0A517NMR4_9BACT|nr:hypothetical protein K239x_03540 [Planctomycetes bacterium K23_9]